MYSLYIQELGLALKQWNTVRSQDKTHPAGPRAGHRGIDSPLLGYGAAEAEVLMNCRCYPECLISKYQTLL